MAGKEDIKCLFYKNFYGQNGTAHFKKGNNYLNTSIESSLERSGGQSSTLHLNVVHFFQRHC